MTNLPTKILIEHINLYLDALNAQLESIKHKIVFDYNVQLTDNKTDSFISDSIFSLLRDNEYVEYEYETNEIKTHSDISELFTTFIEETKEFILNAIEDQKCETLYVVHETDAWNSSNNRVFKGVFNNLLLALWEIQLEYRDVLADFSGFYKSVKEDIGVPTSFDGIDIEEIEINTIL